MISCTSTKNKYSCKMSIDGHTLYSDTDSSKGGGGKGIRPHDILTAALASCINITVRMVCEQLQVDAGCVTTKVELIRTAEQTQFSYSIEFAQSISEEIGQKILRKVESCPVRRTLSNPIEFNLKHPL
ncbi:MAG: OsmC family protein [Bacteroidales bacterium]|nr:OsmC family protein [Bacteroidales bacterium]